MLKTTRLSDVLGSEIENGNVELIGFNIGGNGEKLAKKSGKSKS